MADVKPINSCKSPFNRLKIHVNTHFSYMIFITNSQEHFQTNSATHSVNTRNKNQIHGPTANLSCFQKSAYYAGNKIFNSLSSSLTSLINKKA
jgi:hypothetical protein